jgi:hypothetical protein
MYGYQSPYAGGPADNPPCRSCGRKLQVFSTLLLDWIAQPIPPDNKSMHIYFRITTPKQHSSWGIQQKRQQCIEYEYLALELMNDITNSALLG